MLEDGSVSSGVIEGKCFIEIRFFFARVRKIKYLNKPEENKPTQPIITDPASEKSSILK